MEKIDAHQHFWQLSQPFDYGWLDNPQLQSIRRDYLPEDLKLHLDARQISGSIFVQTQHNLAENRWVLDFCNQFHFLKGIVGWVDLASNDCERQLVEMRSNSKFLGVRHVVQDEPDDDFLVRPEILRGLSQLEKHGIPFDVLIYVKHLRHVPTLARKMPDLKMVINHLAKPQIGKGELEAWRADFEACAEFENVWCKLSGMVTEADWQHWQPADLKPYIEIAIDSFSP
ncbi:MAG: amidohydrolase family protein, partial [bacterium]